MPCFMGMSGMGLRMTMSNGICELYGKSVANEHLDWQAILNEQVCPFLQRTCVKNRKSAPEQTIGTCIVSYGKDSKPIIICPYRLLERKQIFKDCLHLLTTHEPGNELHVVSEISIPGGNVDYVLLSVHDRKVKDFVGIELQTLDTTGTVWPFRQRILASRNIDVFEKETASKKSFGMNWKMTAKTTLVQLHHKIETFEHVNKHLVLAIQRDLLEYMRSAFSFDHVTEARIGDAMHFHAYELTTIGGRNRLALHARKSTDAEGIGICLGLQTQAKVELADFIRQLETKISDETLFTI